MECTDTALLQQTIGDLWALFDELERDAECGKFNHSVFYRLAENVQQKRRTLGIITAHDGLRILPATVKAEPEPTETKF